MSSTNSRIGDWLGISPPAADLEVLRVVESRLDPLAIERLVANGLDPGEIDVAIIPKRRLRRRRRNQEKLTVDESDRAIGLIRVLAITEEVHGGREQALAWLRRPLDRF